MLFLAVKSLVVELPLIWTLLDALGGSPGFGSFRAPLVHEGWGDLLTSVLSVVIFASLESWFQVEGTTKDVSLGSALELTEPKHHLVDITGEGQIRWVNDGRWGDSLHQDTLRGLGKHLQDVSVLTVDLDTDTVGDIIDEAWLASLLLALLGLWIVGEGLVLTLSLLAQLGLLVVDVSLVFALHPNTLSFLAQHVVWWAGALDTLLIVPFVAWWALEFDAFVGSLLSDSVRWARSGLLDTHVLILNEWLLAELSHALVIGGFGEPFWALLHDTLTLDF